jgi:hypothetical protein
MKKPISKHIKFMIYFMYFLIAISMLHLFSIVAGVGAFLVLLRIHPDWRAVDILMNSYAFAGIIGGVVFSLYFVLFKHLKRRLDMKDEKDKMYLCNSHPDYDYIPKPKKKK